VRGYTCTPCANIHSSDPTRRAHLQRRLRHRPRKHPLQVGDDKLERSLLVVEDGFGAGIEDALAKGSSRTSTGPRSDTKA
jgi:hypothetical protein